MVEYIGDLIDMKEAKEREKRYALDASKGCYNYYFTYQNQQYWYVILWIWNLSIFYELYLLCFSLYLLLS